MREIEGQIDLFLDLIGSKMTFSEACKELLGTENGARDMSWRVAGRLASRSIVSLFCLSHGRP